MLIGCMMWRIGEVLELFEQIEWLRAHRFDAVAFWTCGGHPGIWQGFDAPNATASEVARLRSALAPFACVDLHAAVSLTPDTLPELLCTVRLAGELGARTVTIHLDDAVPKGSAAREAGVEGHDPNSVRLSWVMSLNSSLGALNAAAEEADVRVGLELTRDYDLALQEDTPRVGFTLDVGHVSFEGGAGYREFASIGGLIRHVGERLVHVHAHDYDGVLDHLPVGAGRLDWDDIAAGLKSIGYQGVVCLELNPDRATPDQLLGSRAGLEALLT